MKRNSFEHSSRSICCLSKNIINSTSSAAGTLFLSCTSNAIPQRLFFRKSSDVRFPLQKGYQYLYNWLIVDKLTKYSFTGLMDSLRKELSISPDSFKYWVLFQMWMTKMCLNWRNNGTWCFTRRLNGLRTIPKPKLQQSTKAVMN